MVDGSDGRVETGDTTLIMNSNSKIEAKALYTNAPISFWGGIDPLNGHIIDQTHPLRNASTSHKIICLPSGRGSCTGSQVMLELILNSVAPKVLILREPDVILCVGVIIAEEFFDVVNVPVICVVGEEQFDELLSSQDDVLTVKVMEGDNVTIENNRGTYSATNLLRLEDTLEPDPILLEENLSQAKSLAIKAIRRVASISAAKELIPITSAHIDAVTYIGPGGLRFVQKLVELGGKVQVPTTLNSQSVDRRRWQKLGVDSTYASNANSVGDAYLQMGCKMSFTCAPYLLPSRPMKGDDIMW
jgi:predicted aconitase with swiveling domain